MKYRFEIESFTAKKKLPRDERNDIAQYISSVQIEAASVKKAFRGLAEMAKGRLSDNDGSAEAALTLPDYGGCVLKLKAVEVYPLFDNPEREEA